MKPIMVCGLRIVPKWNWSRSYRQWVSERCAKDKRTPEHYEATAERYAMWLAQRDGVSLQSRPNETLRGVAVWEYGWRTTRTGRKQHGRIGISAVRFESGTWQGRVWYASKTWQRSEVIAEISIPNWNADIHAPAVELAEPCHA